MAAAALLRLGFAWDYTRHFSAHALGVLPFLFEPGNIAYSLALGHGFASPLHVPSGPTAWVAPVYPGLLAVLFRVFGVYAFGVFIAAVALNIVFVTLACWPLYALARRLAGPATAALAGWLWAVYPNAILLSYQSMWPGCLAALLSVTALWAIVALSRQPAAAETDPAPMGPASRPARGPGSARRRRPPWLPWLAYGLLWGLILLTDPTLVVLLPLWLLWWIWRNRQTAWSGPVITVVAAIICVIPWTIRNYRALHAWVPVRTDLGLALWLGNNPRATYLWHGQQHPLDNGQQRALYLQQGEVAYMRQKLHLGLAYMATDPARVLDLAWHRFWIFWSGGSPWPLRSLARFRSNWNRYVLLFDLLAGLAALAGMVRLLRRRSPYLFPLAVVVVVVPCAYYLTLAVPRYRLPVDPAVLLLAALCFLPPRQAGRAASAGPGSLA